jgi:hypothetical protein
MNNPYATEPVIDAALVRSVIETMTMFRTIQATDSDMTWKPVDYQSFFIDHTIGNWYRLDVNFSLDTDTGHLLYRLTDFIDEARRNGIKIYPGVTLQDWRAQWEELHPEGIPELPQNVLEPARLALCGQVQES